MGVRVWCATLFVADSIIATSGHGHMGHGHMVLFMSADMPLSDAANAPIDRVDGA